MLEINFTTHKRIFVVNLDLVRQATRGWPQSILRISSLKIVGAKIPKGRAKSLAQNLFNKIIRRFLRRMSPVGKFLTLFQISHTDLEYFRDGWQ
jgi:hypothetical protein